MSDVLRLELTRDEALVLFELLNRYNDSKSLTVVETGENAALQNLLCLLEKELPEPFLPNYEELVRQARERLK
jgi:hypothetical protein